MEVSLTRPTVSITLFREYSLFGLSAEPTSSIYNSYLKYSNSASPAH